MWRLAVWAALALAPAAASGQTAPDSAAPAASTPTSAAIADPLPQAESAQSPQDLPAFEDGLASGPASEPPAPALDQRPSTVPDTVEPLATLQPPEPQAPRPSTVPDGDPALDPVAPAEARDPGPATVADIEDALPDAGRATTDGTGRLIVRRPPPPRPQTRPAPPASVASVAPSSSAIALPAGSGTVDATTGRQVIERLVQLHFLNSAADAQDPALFAEAVRAYQSSVGIAATGVLDLPTIGRLIS